MGISVVSSYAILNLASVTPPMTSSSSTSSRVSRGHRARFGVHDFCHRFNPPAAKTQLHYCSDIGFYEKHMLLPGILRFLWSSEFVSPTPHSSDPSTTLLRSDTTILHTIASFTQSPQGLTHFRMVALYILAAQTPQCHAPLLQTYNVFIFG